MNIISKTIFNYCSNIFKTFINIFNSSLLSLEPPTNLLMYAAVLVMALIVLGTIPLRFLITFSIG